MPKLNKKLMLPIAAAGCALAVGVFSLQQVGAPVTETAPRVRSTAVTPPPAPASHGISFLESLPEPAGPAAPAKPAAKAAEPARQLASLMLPEPEKAPLEARAVTKTAEGGDCKQGFRPMGDCNCFSDALGKVTLTQHPTQACLDEESKRLGHKVVLSTEDGHYELAGVEPEPNPVPVPVKAADLAAIQNNIYVQAQAQPAVAQADAAVAQAAPQKVAMNAAQPLVQFTPFSITPASRNPAAPAGRAAKAPFAHTPVSIPVYQAPAPVPVPAGISAQTTAQIKDLQAKINALYASLRQNGSCPTGSKPEVCRCQIYPSFSYIPSTNAPAFCSSPAIQSVINDPSGLGLIMKDWTNYTTTIFNQIQQLQTQIATLMRGGTVVASPTPSPVNTNPGPTHFPIPKPKHRHSIVGER